MSKQTIGEFIATQRKANGYTQQYVADMLGISNRTLSAWETDKAYPDILILPALAEIYGVTADEIIKGERNSCASATESEISEKSQNKLFKRIIARNSTRLTALLSAGICFAVIFAIGFAIFPEIAISLDAEWLPAVLTVIGIVGTIIVFTLLIIFAKSALSSAGIYSEAERSPNENNFVLNLVKQCARVCNIIGSVWLGGAIFDGFFWVIVNSTEGGEAVAGFVGFMLFFGIPAVIALIILITANVIKMKTVKKCGTAEQISASEQNA